MMPPRIRVEDVSLGHNVSSKGAGSVTSWRSVSTLRVEEKEQSRISSHDEKKPSLKRWWSDATQMSSTGPGTPNWKPLSMSTPILTAVIIASLLMVAGIELLAQKSQRQGGLALSPSLREIPQYAMITSQYVPQVLAVCYSLVWSWIDLDVKRMQPWFEMSKPEGALAGDSLLLDYPYTFVAAVPFTAAKKRHWMVFLSGLSMVLVFWAVTPLQSSQISTDTVERAMPREIFERASLVPVEKQERMLGSRIINLAYAIAWLDQPVPAFTTPEAAYLPFYVDDPIPSTQTTKTNWTGETFRLSTDLDCWPAEVSKTEFASPTEYNFLNGQGCNATVIVPSDALSMFYVGFVNSPHSSFWLENPETCPKSKNFTHQFLATWADIKGDIRDRDAMRFNVSGAYCQTSYTKQRVRLTVDAATRKPDENSMEILAPPEVLQETEFNSTAFEYLLAHGTESDFVTRDYPETIINEQYAWIADRNLSTPTSNMVPFAFARDNRSTDEFSDPEALHQAFRTAHKYIFSFAISQLLRNTTAVADHECTSTSLMSGIVVNRSISAALEALIIIIAVFTALIVYLARKSSTNLDKNPSSIERLAEICQNDPRILDLFSSVSHANDEVLSEITKDDRFRLIWNEVQQCPQIDFESSHEGKRTGSVQQQQRYYEPVKPIALQAGSGVAFVVAILGIIGGLIYLKWAEVAFNGLKKPSQNQEVQQILESYIPTILSTLIEPFWVLVNRLLCVLQPFKDLWKGKATHERTISTTYTSIPPQFVIGRALRSGHFILSIVCSTVFLANILTISLPAIFKEIETTGRYVETFTPAVSTQFNNESIFGFEAHVKEARPRTGSYEEHKYSLLANMSMGTPLLPWVSNEYFFQPWELIVDDSSKQPPADTYEIDTMGFGVNANCTPVPKFELPITPRFEVPQDPPADNCGNLLGIASTFMRDGNDTPGLKGGNCSMEYARTSSTGGAYECQRTLTLGWGRRAAGVFLENGTVEASFAICRPIFQTAMFKVNVDLDGRVLSYTNITDMKTRLDYDGSEEQIGQLIADANVFLRDSGNGWHNETNSQDWLNHLLMMESGSREFLDPNQPVPEPEDLIDHVTTLYSKLFSLLLGLQRDFLFEPAPSSTKQVGKRTIAETRLYLDQTAFITSMIMLGVNVAVAVALYIYGTAFVLPRMPTTLGSLMAYIGPSRMMEETNFGAPGQADQTFSFGRFIGRDGRAHVGIDTDPHVVRIDPSSVGKARVLGNGLFRRVAASNGGNIGNGAWL